MSMNLVVLTGRLTADPEVKVTKSGKSFARFSIAVNRTFKKEDTDFVNIVAWDKKAELVCQYLKKGNMIGVIGSLRTRIYETEDNQKKKITEVLAENIEFLESKKSSSESSFDETKLNSGVEKDVIEDTDFPF